MDPTPTPLTADQVPGLFLAAIPSLREEWPEIESENGDPEGQGGRLGYLDAAWVVGHLAARSAAGDTSELDAAFDLIERLIRDGDDHVSEMGVIGYLEGFHMGPTTAHGVDPASFRPWLRPLSARYWAAIEEFWAHGTLIPVIDTDAEGATRAPDQ